jgi:hypothetical protein
MTYCDKYPNPLIVDGVQTYNPTPEQCQAAGYILGQDPAVVAKQAQDTANAAAVAQTQANAIAALQQQYVAATGQFCAEAGITPVVKVLTAAQIMSAIQAAGSGPTALPLTQLALELEHFTNQLVALCGPSALDQIV